MSKLISSSDPQEFLTLLATKSPPATSSQARIDRDACAFRELGRDLQPDGIVIYDLQDESCRTAEVRPFPFCPCVDSRAFASRVGAGDTTPIVLYKSIDRMSESGWRNWLEASCEQTRVRYLTPVGPACASASMGSITTTRAIQIASTEAPHYTIGGIAIPGRGGSTDYESEGHRMARKTAMGCQYFITQVIYDADSAIDLIHDYEYHCKRLKVVPRRVLLSFCVCGSEKHLSFLKWLGVRVTPRSEQLLRMANMRDMSVDLCCTNLRTILAAASNTRVPLGTCIDNISTSRADMDAIASLFNRLEAIEQQARPAQPKLQGVWRLRPSTTQKMPGIASMEV